VWLAYKTACADWVKAPLASVSSWSTLKSDISLVVDRDVIHTLYYDVDLHSVIHLSVPIESFLGEISSLQAEMPQLPADGESTMMVTATVGDCMGSFAETLVTMTLQSTVDASFIWPQVGTAVHGQTNNNGHFSATLQAGSQPGVVYISATMDNENFQTIPVFIQSDLPEVAILVDAYVPQPYPGESVFPYNRLGGNRGGLNHTELVYGSDRITATVSVTGGNWGGMWMSLNHDNNENLPINFSAILPSSIISPFQSEITGLTFNILDGTIDKELRIELKNGDQEVWTEAVNLTGGAQSLHYPLPPLTDTTNLNWVLEPAVPGDFVVVDSIYLSATMPFTDTAEQGFVWSYGMLLNNWDAETGLVRDQSRFPSGDFEAIQSTGSLAAATAVANQLGYVNRMDAISIVSKISDTLLLDVPKFYGDHGLWPHWVEITQTNVITILPNTEWSTIDTAIAAVGLLEAQQALGLDTNGTETFLNEIDWSNLITTTGIYHGYSDTGELITTTWDTFGGESWLLAVAYAAAEGKVPPLAHPLPPTANGSGFIDELAWLFMPPPEKPDIWCVDWPKYRLSAADKQISYFTSNYPDYQMSQLDLFGLSAAEVPDPSVVSSTQIYQPFGVGGQFNEPNDVITYFIGTEMVTASVTVPHYSAMIASLRPYEAIVVWQWLIDEGLFTPLNNVESFMFVEEPPAYVDGPIWNGLKGSWNLALQTMGWGRHLAEREAKVPILWQASQDNEFLFAGYDLLEDGYCIYLPIILKE